MKMSAAIDDADEAAVSRPDSVLAMVTARASGERVEDASQRDEFSRVFANPDGTWTSETASQPESVQDSNGEWHELDPTLVPTHGVLKPKYAAADLRLSDGGDHVFAALTQDGKDLEWRWPTALPKPTVDANTATYAGAAADGSGDPVVTANETGFSYDVVLHEQPSESLDLVVPVATDGATLKETVEGSLTVATKAGDLPTAAPPKMITKLADKIATRKGATFAQRVGRRANSPKRRKNYAQTAKDKVDKYGGDVAFKAVWEPAKYTLKKFYASRQHKQELIMTDRPRLGAR